MTPILQVLGCALLVLMGTCILVASIGVTMTITEYWCAKWSDKFRERCKKKLEYSDFLLGTVAKHAFRHPDCADCRTITGLRYRRTDAEVLKIGAR